MKKCISLLLCAAMLAALLACPAFAAKKTPKVEQINRYWVSELRLSQQYSYDKKGRVSKVEIWDYSSNEPTCSTIKISYDKNGNPKKITQYWEDGIGEEYHYTNKYNSKKQLTQTKTKAVAVSPTEEDYTIWEDTTKFKYDKSKRLVKKTREYYGTVITTDYDYSDENFTVAVEVAMDGEEELNAQEFYYRTDCAPLSINFNNYAEYIVAYEGLESFTGIYLDDSECSIRDEGLIYFVTEKEGKNWVEIVYD